MLSVYASNPDLSLILIRSIFFSVRPGVLGWSWHHSCPDNSPTLPHPTHQMLLLQQLNSPNLPPSSLPTELISIGLFSFRGGSEGVMLGLTDSRGVAPPSLEPYGGATLSKIC